MRAMIGFAVAAAMLCGCAAQGARGPALASAPAAASSSATGTEMAKLEGTAWRFVEVVGTPVPNGVHATLHLRDGRASGKAGCNAYGASWEMHADGRAKFGAAMSTKMACLTPAGAMRVERGVLDALQHPVHLRRNGGTLVLLDASGKPLAKLAPEDAP